MTQKCYRTARVLVLVQLEMNRTHPPEHELMMTLIFLRKALRAFTISSHCKNRAVLVRTVQGRLIAGNFSLR